MSRITMAMQKDKTKNAKEGIKNLKEQQDCRHLISNKDKEINNREKISLSDKYGLRNPQKLGK